jgi:hypothetical protein
MLRKHIDARANWQFGLIEAVAAATLAAAVSGVLPAPGGLPLVAWVVALAFLPLVVLAIPAWRATLWVFLVWIVVEDLVRKLAGNNLTVYFIKDLFFAVLLIGLFSDPTIKGKWLRATGEARTMLILLIVWAVVMSVPSGLQDPRLPIAGLRLDFLYVPLVIVGYAIALSARSLLRFLKGAAVVGGLACAVGVIQSIVGPSFLSPGGATPGLNDLVLVRTLASDPAVAVYRPTGTFVDPGRFGQVALVSAAIALAFHLLSRRRFDLLAMLAVAVSLAAIWMSGGRTGLLIGGLLVVAAAVAPAFARGQSVFRGVVLPFLGLFLGLWVLTLIAPGLVAGRTTWYSATLDPRSSQNEWDTRWHNYTTDAVRGLELGGMLGDGTGVASLGKQYLQGGSSYSLAGLYQVESGYGSIALEWGAIGLLLWCAFSVIWTRRQWRCIVATRGTPFAAAGFVLFVWMLYFLYMGFFAGLADFQNYYSNAYFWLLSGVLFALPEVARKSPSTDTEGWVPRLLEPSAPLSQVGPPSAASS